MDFYEILKVSRTATIEEIKRAYQELARRYHPDKSTSGSSNNEEFLKIDQAYRVLRDQSTKKVYDSELFSQSAQHLIIHDTISRREFSYEADENIYYHPCKCGSFYTLDYEIVTTCSKEDVILSCDECSLNIKVTS